MRSWSLSLVKARCNMYRAIAMQSPGSDGVEGRSGTSNLGYYAAGVESAPVDMSVETRVLPLRS